MKKLSILIPHYNESEEVCRPLLDSIAMQQGINFKDIEVIIMNDGYKSIFNKDYINKYIETNNINIQYIISQKCGVSAIRNKLLDVCNGEYVMYCDCDDMFYNVCAIKIILDEIAKSHFDTLASTFIEEQHLPNGEIKFLYRENDCTFVHGKVHRKQYLIDNNIRWNEKLYVHEDSYFNCLCRGLTDKAYNTKMAIYLWKWRDGSVCREDKKFLLKTYPQMLISSEALVDEFIARLRVGLSEFYATSIVYETYYLLQEKEWREEENLEYRKAVIEQFAHYWEKFGDLFRNCKELDKLRLRKEIFARHCDKGMGECEQTFDNFIKEVENATN